MNADERLDYFRSEWLAKFAALEQRVNTLERERIVLLNQIEERCARSEKRVHEALR